VTENRNNINTAATAKMHAVITQYEDGRLQGELYSTHFENPFAFKSIMEMITMMEATFDTKGYPEKTMLPRTFGTPKPRQRKNEVDLQAIVDKRAEKKERTDIIEQALDRVHSAYDKDEIKLSSQEAGERTCNFEITVRFRHNAEWQGDVFWQEKNVTKKFSSILELTKLMDNALS